MYTYVRDKIHPNGMKTKGYEKSKTWETILFIESEKDCPHHEKMKFQRVVMPKGSN